ncbi:MAG: FhaA domain-containing protein [Aridibacter sp.]
MSVLDKVRRWIDGESAELVLEQAARDAQVSPRSQAEEFIVKIARAVEDVMQKELVPLPQGTTIIPTEYIIFLSEEDDKEWQGAKRRGLEQGLYHVLAERAKEIAGKKKLETQSFAVELRVDGTLEKDEIRVQHSWEESSNPKTKVEARPKPQKPKQTQNHTYQPNPTPPTPNFTQNQPLPSNMTQQNFPRTAPNYQPQANPNDAEELTRVNQRNTALYNLEIWRDGVRQNVVPIYNREIVIGRGSRSKPVDIALAGDPEISRRHLTLILDNSNNFVIINEGRNSTVVNNNELPVGQRIQVAPGQHFTVCSYMLRIQP